MYMNVKRHEVTLGLQGMVVATLADDPHHDQFLDL